MNYLAIDIGTTNWKVAIYNGEGKSLAIVKTPTKTHSDNMGKSWYNPTELWSCICDLIKDVTSKCPVEISAISATSFSEAVVGIDKSGNAVGDIIAWFDTRSMKQAQQLKDRFTEKTLYSITGLDVNPIFSLPKIMWIRENEKSNYDKTIKYLQMADFIIYRLSGVFATDYTLASRTLALDVKNNCYSDTILDKVNVDKSLFPSIFESGTVISTISDRVSKETGLSKNIKVVVGGNDHPCASIAAGVLGGNKILDSSGTAESFIYVSKKNAIPKMEFKGQRVCRYLQKDRYALWGGIISSGRTFDWAYDLFTSSKRFSIDQAKYTWDEVLDQVLTVKGMEAGLLFYPHLRGAGAPYWNPQISASFMGAREYHDSATFLRATLEGLSMQARMIVEMEENLAGVSVDSLCVVGGGARNPQWQTIKASITGKTVELCEESEATSLGAAMLAALGNEEYESLEEISSMLSNSNKKIEPDFKIYKKMNRFYDLYKEGYEQTEKFNQRIFDEIKGNK
jgi:sugar (pentulose or hexulose) kinase